MLKSLHLENFTVFPDVDLTFGKNLNIIVGENGSGKTHILKAAYAAIAVSAARAKDRGDRDSQQGSASIRAGAEAARRVPAGRSRSAGPAGART